MKIDVVLGAGMQGPAAAYDLARFGNSERIVLADVDPGRAESAANRINHLLGDNRVHSAAVDATDPHAVGDLLRGARVAVSALPYTRHEAVHRAGLEVGCSVVDMGIDTDDLMRLRALSAECQARGVALVMDAGLAPGLVNCLADDLIRQFARPERVRLYCGGLPQHPKPPLGYELRFSAEGLIGEYMDDAFVLRSGEVVRLDPLTEDETLDFEGFGTLEASVTSGGAGAAPYDLKGIVSDYEYKTLRYPGHFAAMRLFRDVGLWSDTPLADGTVPRDAFARVLDRELRGSGEDVVVTRVTVEGDGLRRTVDVIDRQDRTTGFTAMERLTGFSTAITAIEVAEGHVPAGVWSMYQAVPGSTLATELRRRGIAIDPARTG